MNYYIRLFILKNAASLNTLLFGYALPDYENEPRPWASGKLGKKLHLFQLTCVMDEGYFRAFQQALVDEETVKLNDDFSVSGRLTARPEVIRYPKREISHRSESLLTTLSMVREYWNLDKAKLFRDMLTVCAQQSPGQQRQYIRDVLEAITAETKICFLQESAERLGNFEVYRPLETQKWFAWEMQKEEDRYNGNITARALRLWKKKAVTEPLLVNCVLENAKRCVLNQTVEWLPEETEKVFTAEEVVSKLQLSIWRKSDGQLIYYKSGCLMRQLVLSMNVISNTTYLIHDSWTTYLEKTFGGGSAKQKKLDKVRRIQREYAPMVTRIGNYREDPWDSAGQLAEKLAGTYRRRRVQGAFCKKVGEGECEIDSFCKVAEYLNARGVGSAIIVDPYFSVRSMEKLLSRITNENLKLEIVTSLSNIDPDAEGNAAVQQDYLEQVRRFLRNNAAMIHQHLKIINVTRNGNTAIHDRYLLRWMEDEGVDAYLLSNSLNAAGKNYHFVIAQMDQEVAFEVLDYVHEITDVAIQAKRSRSERLDIEVLWDTFEQEYEKEITALIPSKKWEHEMLTSHAEKSELAMEDFFGEGWNRTEQAAKESLCRLFWYLYHSNELSVDRAVQWMKEQSIDLQYIVELCREIAKELEQQVAACEEVDRNRKHSECYTFRCALDPKKQEQVRVDAECLLQNFLYIFYPLNGYLRCLYELLFEISVRDMVQLMRKLHSPLALEVLLRELEGDIYRGNDYRVDVYGALLGTDLLWLWELAYYYYVKVMKHRLDAGDVLWDAGVMWYLSDQKETAVYQYACWVGELSFALGKEQSCRNCNPERRQRFKEAWNLCQSRLAGLLDAQVSFDWGVFWELYNGANEGINCENACYLWDRLQSPKHKACLEESVLNLLSKLWKQQEQFYSHTSAQVTNAAAYMAYVRWGNDVDKVFEEMKLGEKELHTALRPDIYDVDYDSWNQAVQTVLWHMLFLQDYLNFWKEEELYRISSPENGQTGEKESTEEYRKVMEHLKKLSKIEGQCERWHDTAGLTQVLHSPLLTSNASDIQTD